MRNFSSYLSTGGESGGVYHGSKLKKKKKQIFLYLEQRRLIS